MTTELNDIRQRLYNKVDKTYRISMLSNSHYTLDSSIDSFLFELPDSISAKYEPEFLKIRMFFAKVYNEALEIVQKNSSATTGHRK